LKKVPTLDQVVDIIEEIAPKSLALPGDPVGLQYGSPEQPVKRLMISLDATSGTLTQAGEFGADLLVTHHPLLFEPLTPDSMSGTTGAVMVKAVSSSIAVYSAHTNLDAAPQGINSALADLLGLRDQRVLQSIRPELYKVVVFVPRANADSVRSAAFNAGAGRIGNYSGCSFTVDGTGTFHPGEEASPAVGKTGTDVKVEETRLEMTVPSGTLGPVLFNLRKAHPYEEPAIDVYPIRSEPAAAGLGLAGTLPERMSVGEVAARVLTKLKAGNSRLVGKKGSKVRTVAVCAGSGASLLDAAAAVEAQLYITGDMKYHEARKAEGLGINVLDIGHYAPEKYGLKSFGNLLNRRLTGRGFTVQIAHAKEKDPFLSVP
jgi:dinuclear metal center YbgI/SA1388 family protein